MVAPTRRRLTAEQREQQLLDVAEELFTERGLEGVSVEDIARAAGISRPIVYQHHGSREGIFVACVRRARDDFEATLSTATAIAITGGSHSDGGMDHSIAVGGAVFLDLVATNPRRWALLFSSSASLGGVLAQQLLDLRLGTIGRIAELAHDYAPDVDDSVLFAVAHVVSGIGEQLGRWWMGHPEVGLERVLAMYVASVGGAVRGLLAAEVA